MTRARSFAWVLGATMWMGCSAEPSPRDAAAADVQGNGSDVVDSATSVDARELDVSTPDVSIVESGQDAMASCACGTGAEDDFDPAMDTTIAGGTRNFRRFRVREGVTVRVTGAAPLVVFAREPVEIAGTLNVSGVDGREGACETSSMQQPGGAAGAGGTAGGAGGARRVASVSGEGDLGGGAAGFMLPGGSDGDSAGGGGGGGGSAMAGTAGTNGACCPTRCPWGLVAGEGAGGRSGRANDAGDFVGGGGGGGGAYGRADNGNGGSGGGGGGAMRIVAPSITITGTLVANGGNGGSAGRQSTSGMSAECDGGAGGGGGGGYVWLQSSRVVMRGTVSAQGGAGGITVEGMTCGVGGLGGRGSDGFVRVDAEMVEGASVPAAMRRGFDCAAIAECRR